MPYLHHAFYWFPADPRFPRKLNVRKVECCTGRCIAARTDTLTELVCSAFPCALAQEVELDNGSQTPDPGVELIWLAGCVFVFCLPLCDRIRKYIYTYWLPLQALWPYIYIEMYVHIRSACGTWFAGA